MTGRNSFLPSINGGRFSSSSKAAAITSQKHHHTTDFMWKNPSLKYPWRKQKDRQKGNFAGLPNKPELFLGYDISTPIEMSEITARNRAIHVDDFVKNYACKKELELPSFNPQQRYLVKRKTRMPEFVCAKQKLKEISILPLEFTEEVIRCRADPRLSSYFSTDMKKLYKLKNLSISATRTTKDKSSKAGSKRILPQRHKLCMPDEKANSKLKLPPKSKYSWRKEVEENTFKNQVGKSTHLWEKYVLGLISKQTAQWIANQCSSGEQRGRLVGYLDEKYEIKNLEKDGTATVNKILSINDDALSLPKKDKNTSQAGPETVLHSNT